MAGIISIENKEKCVKIFNDQYGRKSYFNSNYIHEVRQFFKTRVSMLPLAGNYSNDRRVQGTNWLCKCKVSREEESHLISGNCEVYGDIRKKYDKLEDDENLVQFFKEVLEMRVELEEKENNKQSM